MSNGVTTEWEDVQVKFGNYLPREKQQTNDETEAIAIQAVESYDPLENKTIEQLKELEDDEDDEVLKAYTEKRMAELKELLTKPKFGKVFELRKQDFIQEVNKAPQDVYVVVHLYQNWSETSNRLSQIFDSLAARFALVKFMRIVSTNCIENYKDEDVPGVIVYYNGQLYKQLIPAHYYFGGKNGLSAKKVEWILGSLKILKSDLEDDPFEEYETHKSVSLNKKKEVRDDESDEEEREDRGYSWKI